MSYDSVDVLETFAGESGEKWGGKVTYPLLADPGSATIKAFGVLQNPEKGSGFARPHIFLVNAEGKITGKFWKEDYKVRPEIPQLLAHIDKVQGG